jgi:membrane protein implicated in regulation of membrane protease activity
MAWWGWIIGGAILLGAELTLVNAQFYLVFVGAAAILTGLMSVAAPSLPEWTQWALFAIVALVSMVLFRSRVYQRFHRTLPKVSSGPTGGVITLPVSLPAGQTCQAEYGGTFWTVCNESERAIDSGSRARITGVRDLTLLVKPDA